MKYLLNLLVLLSIISMSSINVAETDLGGIILDGIAGSSANNNPQIQNDSAHQNNNDNKQANMLLIASN